VKVLVTGAAGFIGSAVTEELANQGHAVVALDALLAGLYPSAEKVARSQRLESNPNVDFYQLDLREADLSALPSGITHVIHEAAMPGLGLSWNDFALYESCNLTATARLIEAAAEWPLERFIQISTSSVYGKTAAGDETLALAPASPYGVTKLAAENLALAHWRDSAFPASVLRYFSVYGPGQRPDMAYRKFIAKALAGETITLFGTGEQTRSNTYVDDCVAATISALTRSSPGEIYNISGHEERSISEALGIIEAEVGRPLRIDQQPAARGDQLRTAGDSSKAQEKLGFTHTVTLESGLARQVEWQRSLGNR